MKKAKRTKRLLAGLLALLLAVTGVPLYSMEVQAEDGVLMEGDYRYEVNEDGNSVKITGYNGNGGDVTIPDTIDGKNVIAIDNSAFLGCATLTGLTISGNVDYIGDSAFSGCTNLTSLSISNSVTHIDYWAFRDCTSLENLSIPHSVTTIHERAFENCNGLTSITVAEDNKIYDSRNSCNSIIKKNINRLILGCKNSTIPDSVASIGQSAFSGCSGLTNLIIPSSVSSIDFCAFKGCSGLTSITIPDSVRDIAESVFEGCSSLTSITIPDSVCDIRTSAFEGCSSLTSITIPDSVSGIGYKAFYNCMNLTSITIPKSVYSIGEWAFGYVTNPYNSNQYKIPDFTIYGAHGSNANTYASLNEFTFIPIAQDLSSAIITLGKSYYTYDGTPKVPSVTVELDGETLIPDSDYTVFYSDNINVGTATVTVTGKGGYKGTVIETFTIDSTGEGNSGTTGDETTTNNLSDAEITLEGEDDGYVWDGTPKTPVVTVKLNGKTLIQDTDYTVSYNNNTDVGRAQVIVTGMGNYHGSTTTTFQINETGWKGNYKYTVNKDGNSVTLLKYDGTDHGAKIPETIAGKTVTVIDKEAFSLWSSWSSSDSPASLTIPASVTSIGNKAFYNWRNLKSITIPSAVTSIGDYAFGFYEYEMDPDDGGDIINKKVADFTIYGESGSAAEKYAERYGFPFNVQSTGGNTGGTSQNDPSQTDLSKATVTLEKDAYPYDGKAKTPAVTVTLSGKTLSPSTDYTVAYTDNINVGTAKATVTGKGNYKGSVTKTFTITKANNSAGNNGSSDGNGSAGTSNSKQPITCKKRAYTVSYGTKPFKLKVTSNGSLTYKSSNSKIAAVGKTNGKVTIKNTGIAYITAKTNTDSVKITIKVSPAKPKVKSLSVGKDRKLTVKWAKDKKATGYQVQVSTSKNFKKNLKKQNVTKTTCTFKKLKAGSKYYVRLRSFKKSGKITLYSAWSNAKKSNKIKR